MAEMAEHLNTFLLTDMQFEIIEDCSPYFIRYKHTGSDEVIEMCQRQKKLQVDYLQNKRKFIHCRLPENTGIEILNKVYKSQELSLATKRVSLFVTQARHYYRPHRDGLAVPMGINYNVDILDDKCVTSWYDNSVFAGRPIDNLITNSSREIKDYNRQIEKNIIKPVKSMTAKQGEVLLFNTDFFHDVDNENSPNERTILTLRSTQFEKINFLQARKILFGY
jgi:hypothetical protein